MPIAEMMEVEASIARWAGRAIAVAAIVAICFWIGGKL